MSAVDLGSLVIALPLREDPLGLFCVGPSGVRLDSVLRAFQQGASAEGIVRSYPLLRLADVYAVIAGYLTNPAPFEDYLRRCDEQASALCESEAAQISGIVDQEQC